MYVITLRVSFFVKLKVETQIKKNILNFLLFQIGWFSCLLLSGFWPLLLGLLILLLHFFVIVPDGEKVSESVFLCKVLFVGFLLEALYLSADVLEKADQSELPSSWLLLIWLLFGSTFRYSMSWLRPKLVLAAAFSMIAAPMSYMSGAALNGSVALGEPMLTSIAFLGITWALIFPVLLVVALPQPLSESHSSATDKVL